MTSLWLEASRDIEADEAELSFNKAKIATASLWPFLAMAHSDEEFEHRLALAIDQIDMRIPATANLQRVVDSFREDYKIYREAVVEEEGDDDEPDGDADDAKPWEKNASMQVFHEASQKWIEATAAAEETPGNPGFPNPTPEQGPITGQTGTYPQHPTGADPVDPISQMFPMQPSPWKEIPELWVDRPMNFAPYQNPGNYGAPKTSAVRVTATDYQGEGVQTGPGPNPFYFAGGDEGVAGDQQAGFPADVSAPESMGDERVDMYGAVPPLVSSGTEGDGHPYSNAGNLNNSKESAKDNHGACYDCKQPVYRKGNDWHHLGQPPQNGHSVRLPSDHPWVQARMSSRKNANQYIHKDGDDWVITQKGTGKVLSRHDSEEKANASFRAMEWSKHSGSLQFYAEASSQDMGSADVAGGENGNAPEPPPSMTPGGPGSIPQPPVNQAMTIPNQSVSQNPFPNEPMGGGGGAAMNPFTGATRVADAQTRDRPDMFNPTGAGDEFTERTWNGQVSQSPRQPMEDRNVNTPQRPQSPIPQNSSNGGPREEEEGEED